MSPVAYEAGDRVRRSPEHLAAMRACGITLADIGGRVALRNYNALVTVRWDDGSASYGMHHENITRQA